MAKRIVKQTLANGEVQYVVQSNRMFGFIPVKWHTIIVPCGDNEFLMHEAVFSRYKDACFWAGFCDNGKKVVKEEVIETK